MAVWNPINPLWRVSDYLINIMNPFALSPHVQEINDKPSRLGVVASLKDLFNKENGSGMHLAHTPVKTRERNGYADDTPFSILKSAYEDSACVHTRSRKYNDSALPLQHWKPYDSHLKAPRHDKTPFEEFFDLSGKKSLVFHEHETEQMYQLTFNDALLQKRTSPCRSARKRRVMHNRSLFENITLSPSKFENGNNGEKAIEVATKQLKAIPGTGCNCEKSKCLKMYCDCLKNGGFCGPNCFCTDCENKQESMVRERKLNAMKRRVASLAAEIIGLHVDKPQHLRAATKGCNCKKSGCLKNYCECHQAGAVCGDHCKCKDCKNTTLHATARDPLAKRF